jgi:3-methyl-2-oxobutanoate hydroxymethyltransferase
MRVVAPEVTSFLCSQTTMIPMSLGSCTGWDKQFLFSDDIFGDYEERLPRHAKAYRNFVEEHRRLQRERIAAFSEYIADVKEGRIPERSPLVELDEKLLQEVIDSVRRPARRQSKQG